MQKEESVIGIIGFFDILGYQSFIQNNEPETAAHEVLNTLIGIDKKVMEYIAKIILAPIGVKSYEDDLKKIRWLVFSDTILITSLGSEPETAPETTLRWLLFLSACAVLQRHMFEFGLPLRGAITTGKFVIKGNCFAGRPIIEGYQLTQNIDLAATIFSSSAYDELSQTVQNTEQQIKEQGKEPTSLRQTIEGLTLQYLVPLETMEEKRYTTFNFLAIPTTTGQKPTPDVAQMVFEAFWKHNKDIPSDASKKATNTEQYLRFLKYKHPTHFQH